MQPLLDKWLVAKRKYIEAFGGQLQFEYPDEITLELSDDIKRDRIADLCNFIEENYSSQISEFLNVEANYIFENKVGEEVTTYDGETIPVGMKIGKALTRYFNRCCSCAEMEDIQQRLAMIIQENKVTGILGISVHPLDFLSSSENQHKWRSCHALNGEYRSGNLSYMMDECTVICYIRSKKETELPRFPADLPWNNKKWRCLFFFDQPRGTCYAGRQYPFFSKQAMAYCAQLLFRKFHWFSTIDINGLTSYSWRSDVCNFQPTCFKQITNEGEVYNFRSVHMITPTNEVIPLEDIVTDAKGSQHYSSFYVPWTCQFRTPDGNFETLPKMVVGGAIPCVECGTGEVAFSDAMVCEDCMMDDDNNASEDVGECPECGRRIIRDDDFYFNGEYYCEECYSALELTQCTQCGEVYPHDDLLYDEKSESLYCPYCYHHRDIHLNNPFS